MPQDLSPAHRAWFWRLLGHSNLPLVYASQNTRLARSAHQHTSAQRQPLSDTFKIHGQSQVLDRMETLCRCDSPGPVYLPCTPRRAARGVCVNMGRRAAAARAANAHAVRNSWFPCAAGRREALLVRKHSILAPAHAKDVRLACAGHEAGVVQVCLIQGIFNEFQGIITPSAISVPSSAGRQMHVMLTCAWCQGCMQRDAQQPGPLSGRGEADKELARVWTEHYMWQYRPEYQTACWQGQDSPGPGYNVGGQAARGCGALGQRRCSSALGTFPRATRRLADASAKQGPLPKPPSRVLEEALAREALPGRGKVRSPMHVLLAFTSFNLTKCCIMFCLHKPPACADFERSHACYHALDPHEGGPWLGAPEPSGA